MSPNLLLGELAQVKAKIFLLLSELALLKAVISRSRQGKNKTKLDREKTLKNSKSKEMT